jgi:hypothetical protein
MRILELARRKPRQRKSSPILTALLGLTLLPALAMESGQTSTNRTSDATYLMGRVGHPTELAIREFRKAGMEDVRPHTLTKTEYARVQAALESLPLLNRDALDKHLHQLAFVDGIPGEGTGLTSPAAQEGQYDITFRASLIDESLSTFLTTKERRVFTDDGSGVNLTVTGTGADALTYVLLHESSHVLDAACGIIKTFPNAFDKDIWTAPHVMVPKLAQALSTQTSFHGGSRVALNRAPDVYDSLSKTPFVSLYATSSAREDFAELVAWRELQKQQGGTLTIEVKNSRSNTDRIWHPLSFPAVQERFPEVDRLQSLEHGCPS